MQKQREMNAYQKKIRMVKKPQSSLANPNINSNLKITTLKQQQLVQNRKSPQMNFELPNDAQNEQILHLEMQKKILSNKLSQLSADYALEDKKRRKLEDELTNARKNATNNYYHGESESDENQTRIQTMESRLEKAQLQFNSNLQKLSFLRNQLTEARKLRLSDNLSTDQTTDAEENENEIEIEKSSESGDSNINNDILELQPNEKEEIANYLKYCEQFSQATSTTSRRKNVSNSIFSTIPPNLMTPQISEIVKQTEGCQLVINKILSATSMKDVSQLLTEAEELEKENKRLYNSIIVCNQAKDELLEDISILENQYNDLITHRNATEEDQRKEIQKITAEISNIQKELDQTEAKRAKEEATFAPVYFELENLFNALECSWDDWSGVKNTVTSANAMYALNAIEATIAELMNDPNSKSKVMAAIKKMHEEESNDKDKKDNNAENDKNKKDKVVKDDDKKNDKEEIEKELK